jgi:tripeptide aminopeptidase
VKIDTQSSEDSDTFPSTPGQLELLRLLKQELIELELDQVTIDENG